jgi:hypothetical protein
MAAHTADAGVKRDAPITANHSSIKIQQTEAQQQYERLLIQ